MTNPAIITLEDAVLEIEADDFTAHVSRVEFVPTRATVAWKSLSPASSATKSGRPTYVCNIDHVQDYKSADSLARYLWDNDGQEKVVTFKPERQDGTPSWTATVQILSGNIGGAVDTVPVASVSLPVVGRPTPDWDDNPVTPNA